MITRRVRLVSSVKSVVLSIVLLAEIITSSQESSKKCPGEVSEVYNSSQTVSWSSRGPNNAIVLSVPPCLDEFGNLIARICSNQSWIPKTPPACSKTIEANRRCPLNFEETKDSCIYVSEPKQWEDSCNIGKISEDSYSHLLDNESVWLPLKRIVKYGPYESITWGKDFGKPLLAASLVPVGDADFFKKDCMILDPQKVKLEPESCTAIHKHICEFDKREGNQHCPKGCVSAGINSVKCYCKQKQRCPMLARVNTIMDKNILADLAGRDQCFVGGGPTSEFALEGSKEALSRNTWSYTTEDLQCSLCSMLSLKQTSGEVEMVLNFEDNQRRLFLMIYSPEKLIGHGNSDTIYCFTDASLDELKARVEVRKITEQTDGMKPFNVYEVALERYMGQYWCEVYENSVVLKSNTVVAYEKKEGHEYALRIVLSSVCLFFKCKSESPIRYEEFVPNIMAEIAKDYEIRVMDIFFFDFKTLDFLLHITTTEMVDIIDEFSFLENSFLKDSNALKVVYFKSSEFCLPNTTFTEDGKAITWPLTLIGQTAIPEEICLQANGMPIYRLCEGDFLYGATWGDVTGECQNDKQPNQNTLYLYSLLNQSLSNDTVGNLSSVIRSEPDLPVLSIYYITKILDNIFSFHRLGNFVDGSFDVIGATVNITDCLLNVKRENLAEAQYSLNITDSILDLVDDILKQPIINSGVFLIQKENVIVHICNPLISNVSGVVVYTGSKGVRVENMKRYGSFEDVKYNEDFWMAFHVPEEILLGFQGGNISVITTIFLSDRFFVSNYSKEPTGPVISVTIPEYGCYLPSMLPILFKSVTNGSPECGFWDYGKKTTRKRGSWSTVGGNHLENYHNESFFHICQFSHLTHFALLILKDDLNPDNAVATVGILLYLGDFLSVSGISGIFITAIAFKKWRRKQGTIILLNLCIAIILEITLTELARYEPVIGDCHFIGNFLHYVILSKFAWMLVYSFLQYMRFVKVFTILPERIVMISLVFGWGFALIPVTIIVLLRGNNYSMLSGNFCYPSGLALYLGLFAPIIAIISINTFVFIAVMRQITAKTVEAHSSKDNIQKLQMQLATLLFFVLGMPWILLVLTNFVIIYWLRMMLVYIFTIMSNIDGLILFLFYVVFNHETRKFWVTFFTKKNSKTFSISSKISSFRS